MVFFTQLGNALLHIITAPSRQPSILWQIIPLLLMWMVLQSYFGEWKESLGWNSALANAVTLFWTLATTMQVIFGNKTLFTWPKFLILLLGMIYSIVLGYIVFKHSFKAHLTFMIASPVLIYYLAMIFILWSHNLIIFNWYVLLAVLIYFGIFVLIDFVLKKILDQKPEDDDGENQNKPSEEPINNIFEESKSTNIEEPIHSETPMNTMTPQNQQDVYHRPIQRRRSPFEK